MFSGNFETVREKKSGFCEMASSVSFEELKKLTLQASQGNNIYGLAQCMFEQYKKCKYAWSQFQFDSETYTGKGTISYDRPSLAEDGTALYFKRSIEKHGALLNHLLSETTEEFFDDFYKKYQRQPTHEINSFFNLINYISKNMDQLNLGFNNVAIMAIIHQGSVKENDNRQNIYQKHANTLNLGS